MAPFDRASESPMAIACLRDLTFAPLLLRSVPRFLRRIALSTRFEAAFPYFGVPRREGVRFVAGMATPRKGVIARYRFAALEPSPVREKVGRACRVVRRPPGVSARIARRGNVARWLVVAGW